MELERCGMHKSEFFCLHRSGARTKGTTVTPPKEIIEQLPSELSLDGELVLTDDPGERSPRTWDSQISTLAQRWHQLSFYVFDAPYCTGKFEERLEILRKEVKVDERFVQLMDIARCSDVNHLLAHLSTMMSRGAEGLLLRAPGSLHEPKRSSLFLKVKPFCVEPAKVVAISGFNCVHCILATKKTIAVHQFFSKQPEVGSVVMVKYNIRKRGISDVSLSYANNISWDDVESGMHPPVTKVGGLPFKFDFNIIVYNVEDPDDEVMT